MSEKRPSGKKEFELGSVKNLTPHPVVMVFDKETGDGIKYPSNGKPVRIKTEPVEAIGDAPVQGGVVPIVKAPVYKEEIEWPDLGEKVDTIIVSMVVGTVASQAAAKGLHIPYNVVVPDTGPGAAVRSKSGEVIGSTRFSLYAAKSETPEKKAKKQ